MALDPSAIHKTTEPIHHSYTMKDTVLYALSIGAKRDQHLPFLFEKYGPQVFPTYGTIPATACLEDALKLVGGDFRGVVHSQQKILVHAPFAPSAQLTSVGEVLGVYDMKRFGLCSFGTKTYDQNNELLCETEAQVLFRFDGNFGGERPPTEPKNKAPERPADFELIEHTTQEQALFYRLNGDLNPLHADPDLAKEVGFTKPILHGLCTFGIIGRALTDHLCNFDSSKLRSLSGQFRRPVTPGESLLIRGWKETSGYIVRASLVHQPDEIIFTNGFSEILI